jgi:hypothetical protein
MSVMLLLVHQGIKPVTSQGSLRAQFLIGQIKETKLPGAWYLELVAWSRLFCSRQKY